MVLRSLARKISGVTRSFERLVNVYPDTPSVARRMFATNSFDGLLSALGVNVGGFRPDVSPEVLAFSIIGGSVAMGFLSGVVGVYLSERAERIREVKELERKVASSLKKSIYWKAANYIPVYISLWSGAGIILFPMLVAVPYLAASIGLIGMIEAYYASLGVALTLMSLLGVYLARISGGNPVVGAARGLALGVAGIVVVSLVKKLFGAALLG